MEHLVELKSRISVRLEQLAYDARNCENFEELEELFEEAEFILSKLKSQAIELQQSQTISNEFEKATDTDFIDLRMVKSEEEEEYYDDEEEENYEDDEEDIIPETFFPEEPTSDFPAYPEEEGTKER